MKRGFLNSKKAQRGVFQGVEPKPGVLQPEILVKVPHKTVENTTLPAGYNLAQIVTAESPATNMSHPANGLQMLTIPARVVGQPPDPDGHSEWLVRGLTKNKVLNLPGYPQPVPKPPGNGKAYIVKSTPTMGKGVFATRDIPRDGMIFAERPLLIIPCGMALQEMGAAGSEYNLGDYTKMAILQQERHLEMALGRMEPESRAKFMALTNRHSEEGRGTLNGIFRTNGYAVHNLTDGEFEPNAPNPFYYSAVCDVGSRINHSCLPNIAIAFKLSAFSMIFFATRDIKAGEQLFYSYCCIKQSTSERKAELAPYGFTCTCASCVHATPETDALRKTFYARIQEYGTQSLTWKELPTFPVEILDDLLRYQRAVIKEGLDVDFAYCLEFLPALVRAYQLADRANVGYLVIREIVKRNASREEAMKLMR